MTKELEHASVTERHDVCKRKSRKSWCEYSQQHKCQNLEQVKGAVGSVLNDENLQVLDDKRSDSTINLSDKHADHPLIDDSSNMPNLLLYAKERFRISDAAYHEQSMLFPVLPRTCQVKQCVRELDEQW